MDDFSPQCLGNMAWAFENMRSVSAAAAVGIIHPFKAYESDHCETSAQAFESIAPFLDLVAARLGKDRSTLSIYDPYFCAGTMKKHLWSLGFHTVYNECEDFYAIIREGRLPPHDVLVTNPPYGEGHVQRLLSFCSGHDKPYLLLMPDYVLWEPLLLQSSTACVEDTVEATIFVMVPVMCAKRENLRR